jgi:arginine/ornithine transport system ATP-binding protein
MTQPVSHLGLVIDNLHKRFGEREVLRGVSLAARPGDVVAIIGASGSGKSTLLRCLNLLEQPHEGTMKLGAETLALKRDRDGSLTAADPAQLRHWRSRLAFVFQSFNLWQHRTAIENVTEAPIASCWRASGSRTARTTTRPSSRAASSSGWRSPARWPSTRR